jgi:hypothetical protein
MQNADIVDRRPNAVWARVSPDVFAQGSRLTIPPTHPRDAGGTTSASRVNRKLAVMFRVVLDERHGEFQSLTIRHPLLCS